MILAVDEKQPDCKNKQPISGIPGWAYYCACEFSSYHQMMNGMCCSSDYKCGCCSTDPIISKLPQYKKYWDENQKGGECGEATQTCIRKEGWPISSCCNANYGLTTGDQKFVSTQTSIHLPRLPAWGPVGMDLFLHPFRSTRVHITYQHIPRYAVTYPTITYAIPEQNKAILDWYWVPRVVPPGTGDLWKERKFSWVKENTADMVGALDKDQKCKDKPVYCACDPLHFDQIMKGMCCDKSANCECCRTDPTLSKMEKAMAQDPKTSSSCKDQIKANFGKKPTFCQWTERWNQSAKCCDEDYKLVIKDDRYDAQKVSLTTRYASIEGMSRHNPTCDKRLPWIYPGICSFEWYWVPQSIGNHGG
uniref:DB domain-containing protein n=1 Tax=Globodera pallida TaxID=36090 RepID=A0A183C7J0_GLOPA